MLLALGTIAALASPAPAWAQSKRERDEYMLTTEPGQHHYDAPMLRNTGRILTSVGLASTFIGGMTMIGGAVADAHCDHNDSGFCTFNGVMVGGYTLLGSAAVLAIGIPMWVAGSRAPDGQPVKARQVPITLNLRATSASVRLDF